MSRAERELAAAFASYMGVRSADDDERLFSDNVERYVGLSPDEATLAFQLDRYMGLVG